MRPIQRTLVPDAAPWQLAEMFLSGLLYRDRMPEAPPGELGYSFLGDIRQRLRDDAGPMRRVETRLLVSQYLLRRAGKGATLDAVVATDVKTKRTCGVEPFATLPQAIVGVAGALIFADFAPSFNQEIPLPVANESGGIASFPSVGLRGGGVSDTLSLSADTKEFVVFRTRLARFLEQSAIHVLHQDDFFHRGVKTLHALEEGIASRSSSFTSSAPSPAGTHPSIGARLPQRHKGFVERFPAVAGTAREGQLSAAQWKAWLALFFGRRLYSYELSDGLLPARAELTPALHRPHEHPKPVENEDDFFLRKC